MSPALGHPGDLGSGGISCHCRPPPILFHPIPAPVLCIHGDVSSALVWRCFLCPGNAQLALGNCTYDVNTGPLPILLTNLLQSGVQCFSTDNETVLETLKSLTEKLLARGVLTYRCNVSFILWKWQLCAGIPLAPRFALGFLGQMH